MNIRPQTVDELCKVVKAQQHVLPVGGGSKPALSAPSEAVTLIEMGDISGIIEYEPGEYTFTAYAGTPVKTVIAALAEHQQYLPFDPIFVERGATLGGTVAANTSGSGRFRFGGVRDFILGVRFVDSSGDLVRSGGKVVKNAAGFDLPKFFVGSMGRYGILAEISFKVFPQPSAYVTLRASYATLQDALNTTFKLATSAFDIDMLDIEPGEDVSLVMRLGGLSDALPGRLERLQAYLSTHTQPNGFTIVTDDDRAYWSAVNDFSWCPPDRALVKVPIAPRQMIALEAEINGPHRYTAGGHVAWLAVDDPERLHHTLTQLNLTGLALTGQPGHPILGQRKGIALAQRVKRALDPAEKFLEI